MPDFILRLANLNSFENFAGWFREFDDKFHNALLDSGWNTASLNDPYSRRRGKFKLRRGNIAVDFDLKKSEIGTRFVGIENGHAVDEKCTRIHFYFDFIDILAFPIWRQQENLVAF